MLKLTVELVGSEELIDAIKDIAAAIRQYGIQQAQLDELKAKLDANDAAVEEALKK